MRMFFYSLVVAVFGFVSNAQAGTCGGFVEFNKDCASSHKNFSISCCPSGVVTGVAYTDLGGEDYVDAVSAICANSTGENVVVQSDFSKQPGKLVCKSSETFVGIYVKDALEKGDTKDELDGLTAICQDKKTQALRKVTNKDIEGGREGTEITKLPPNKIVGIAYKEIDKGNSDRADCATIITK